MEVRVQSRGELRGYSINWVDDYGKKCQRILGQISWEEAWKRAGKMELLLESSSKEVKRTEWIEFRLAFEKSYTRSVKPSTFHKQITALNALESVLHPVFLDEVNALNLVRFSNEYKASIQTIRSYLGHIRLALRWAYRMQLLETPPIIYMPRGKDDPSRGRPLTEDELQCMVDSVAVVRKRSDDVIKYANLIRGLSLSGMRIEEAICARWNDSSAGISIQTNPPRWSIEYSKQKNGKVSILPVMPDFQKFLEPFEKKGSVFGISVSSDQASRVISAIGEAAGIIVSSDSHCGGGPKYASAHDLRRTFAARWAEILPEAILATLMRHKSADTTRKHYAKINSDRLAHVVEEAVKRRGG